MQFSAFYTQENSIKTRSKQQMNYIKNISHQSNMLNSLKDDIKIFCLRLQLNLKSKQTHFF